MKLKRRGASRRGSALVLALIVVTMVAALGAAYLRVATAVTSRQTSEVESMQAFYLAEAGLAEAFQAVRVGRTGQVGSETLPAAHGDGLLWVDATETADDQVRLECTAMVGPGRATLALIVEPVEIPLGFFSDEELVVESVLLVDGFNSEEATYEQEVGGSNLNEVQAYAARIAGIIGQGGVITLIEMSGAVTKQTVANTTLLGAEAAEQFVQMLPPMREAHAAGTLFPDSSVESAASLTDVAPSTEPSEEDAIAEIFEVHTDGGGLLASNGDIRFALPSGEPVELHGDAIPGPNGTVQGLTGALVTGSTDPRSTAVELPAVEVPVVTMAAPTRHDGLLPMLVSPGTSGHERIEVGPDAELILRGPATIVIGDLILEPGALLTLDTRDGNVELFVTGGMDLQPDSVVTTSSDFPDELSIQVAAIPTGAAGAPVQLEATSQFHGTIYSPETDVRVGSEFEVFGSIVARRLELGAGAKLHFDSAKFDGSPIPRLVSWKIVEIPSTVRGRRGDPYEVLGLERGTLEELSEAHDLSSVWLTIEYKNSSGALQNYSGTEDGFDWDQVAEVMEVGRDADRVLEDPTGTEEPPIEDPLPVEELSPIELELLAKINDSTLSSGELSSLLMGAGSLSDTVLGEAIGGTSSLTEKNIYDLLEKHGLINSGFPTGESTTPLSGAVLLKAIQNPNYGSQYLMWNLKQNSPLPADVLQAAIDRDPPMRKGDLNQVKNAQ